MAKNDDGSSTNIDDGGTFTYLCTRIISGGMTKCRITDTCPWSNIMALVPLSPNIFISGSAATWLAERSLMRSTPDWSPHDVDVFACLPSVDFDSMVAICVHRLSTNCEISIVRPRGRYEIIDVTTSNSPYTLSFIRCPPMSRAGDVVQQFDINICTPVIVQEDGALWVNMTNDVASSICDRRMRCVVRKKNPAYLNYPFQRTMNRVRKYISRGYAFASLTFESTAHIDFAEHDDECALKVDDFVFECKYNTQHADPQ